MEEFGSLYDNMLGSLKMERLNEGITNLGGTYVMSIVSMVSIITFVLSL